MGRVFVSTVLLMVCEVVSRVGLALFLLSLWGLEGILYSMPVPDIVTFLIVSVAIRSTYKILKMCSKQMASSPVSVELSVN